MVRNLKIVLRPRFKKLILAATVSALFGFYMQGEKLAFAVQVSSKVDTIPFKENVDFEDERTFSFESTKEKDLILHYDSRIAPHSEASTVRVFVNGSLVGYWSKRDFEASRYERLLVNKKIVRPGRNTVRFACEGRCKATLSRAFFTKATEEDLLTFDPFFLYQAAEKTYARQNIVDEGRERAIGYLRLAEQVCVDNDELMSKIRALKSEIEDGPLEPLDAKVVASKSSLPPISKIVKKSRPKMGSKSLGSERMKALYREGYVVEDVDPLKSMEKYLLVLHYGTAKDPYVEKARKRLNKLKYAVDKDPKKSATLFR